MCCIMKAVQQSDFVERSFTVNNDFKKSSYVLTIIFFFIGIAALVGVSAGKYFQFDEIVVTVSQIVSLLAFFIIFINCIYAKSRYNNACVRFAEYIINNRRKESERKFAEAERMQEVENTVRAEAQRDREKAVTAALQQGRSEGAMGARQSVPAQQGFPVPMPTPVQFQQPAPFPQTAQVQPQRSAQQFAPAPMQNSVPVPVQSSAPAQQRLPQRVAAPQREPAAAPNEEVLYNEYGEPVMMRRRVRKTAASPDGEMLYDKDGNPVVRRTQGLWEPLEQRHEIVFKFETAPGMSVSQPNGRDGSR